MSKADQNQPLTFSSGLTLYSPVNTTYSSSVLLCNGTLTCPKGFQSSLNYSIDGQNQGSPLWSLDPGSICIPSIYVVDGSFPLSPLHNGSHRLSIGITEELYNNTNMNSPELISYSSWVNTVYFTVDSNQSPTLAQKITPTTTTIPAAPKVVDTIPLVVPGGYYGVAYDSTKGEVFITNADYGSVSIISDSTNSVVATITVGNLPFGVVYDSGKREIFVANYNSNSVSVISDSNNTVVATIPVGSQPTGLAYDSNKSEIFVANRADNTVSVIADSNNTVVATIRAGTSPWDLAYDSSLGEVFLPNYGSDTISVISDAANSVVANVTVGNNPYYTAYDSGMGEIFVTNYDSNSVSVISDSSNTVVATITGLNHPIGAVYDSGTGEIFVAEYPDSLSVISDASNTVVANIPSVIQPLGFAYDSAKGELFVPNSEHGTVSVISDSSSAAASPSPVKSTSSSSTDTTSPSPTPSASSNLSAPESNVQTYILVMAIVFASVILCAVAFSVRKRRRPAAVLLYQTQRSRISLATPLSGNRNQVHWPFSRKIVSF